MTELRNRLLSLAGVTLAFAGMAFGQATCANPISAGNFIRTEGKTELLADLYITCTNNTLVATAPGAVTNITVYLNLPVTSKLLQTAAAPAVQYTEAIAGVVTAGALPAAASVQGVTNGTQVTFLGIPTPATAAGASFQIAITNVRVDASSINSTVPVPVNETLFINTAVGATPLVGAAVLSNVTVAFAQNGLTAASVPSASLTNFTICGGAGGATGFNVSFGEAFPNSFKIGTAANATLGAAASNNTETGYQPAAFPNFGAAGSNVAVGGTRVQINYAAIGSGVALYVPIVVAQDTGFGPGTLTLTGSATGAFAAVTPSTDAGLPAIVAPNTGWAKLTVTGGTAVAVYEVTTQNPGATDKFTVLTTLKGTVAATAVGIPVTAQVTFAPISAAAGTIPNFVVGTASTPVNGSSFSLCTTTMIFPFITNAPGFDTGLAIANTSTDNLKAGGGNSVKDSAGTCTLSFFGTNKPAADVVTPPVVSGTTYVATLSSLVPNFQGYAIAQCNFLFAHSFAYISYNLTQTNGVSMGYLGLNLGTGRGTPTPGLPESLGN